MNALIAMEGKSIDVSSFDSRLIRNLPSDLRVMIAWDAGDTDMNLWVTDPDGEECYYYNKRTRQGGIMSGDYTRGYGPEEFMLKNAKPGTYQVEAGYFGSGRHLMFGEVTIYVTIATGFGTPRQKEQVVTKRVKRTRESILVGEFTVR